MVNLAQIQRSRSIIVELKQRKDHEILFLYGLCMFVLILLYFAYLS